MNKIKSPSIAAAPTQPLDNQLLIRTPEHVELNYVLAGLGNRFFALFIDSSIQGGIFFVVFVIFGLLMSFLNQMGLNPFRDLPGLLIIAVMIIFLFLVFNGYFIFFETLWSGQTPGKRAMKLRVLREDGRPVGFFEVMVRNVLRVADMLPTFYAVGALVILLSKKNKRLGDYAAGTVVIKERRQQVPAAGPRTRLEVRPHLETLPQPQFQGVLSPEEQTMVLNFLRRRWEMDQGARAQLAQRLALPLAQRLNIPQPMNLAYEAFLEWVAGLRAAHSQ